MLVVGDTVKYNGTITLDSNSDTYFDFDDIVIDPSNNYVYQGMILNDSMDSVYVEFSYTGANSGSQSLEISGSTPLSGFDITTDFALIKLRY